MPNTFHGTTNTWVIDTAGAGVVEPRTVRIQSIRWIGATTAGHQAIVTDTADGRIWSSVAGGANNVESEYFGGEQWYRGFKVPTLESGTLEIVFG